MDNRVESFERYSKMHEASSDEDAAGDYFPKDIRTEIVGASFVNAQFDGDHSGAILRNCDFTYSILNRCDFTNADFSGSRGFGMTKPDENGIPTFYSCNFTGADFTDVDLSFIDKNIWPDWKNRLSSCIGVNLSL
jgi:uncharacterized protein YjbI with pentapeptide repeats